MKWTTGSLSSQNLTCQLALLMLAQFVLQLADMTGTVLEGQCGPINLRLFWGLGGVTLQYTGIPVAGSDPWPAWLGSMIGGWYVCWGTAWEPWVIGTCARHKQQQKKLLWCLQWRVWCHKYYSSVGVGHNRSLILYLPFISFFTWRKSFALPDCTTSDIVAWRHGLWIIVLHLQVSQDAGRLWAIGYTCMDIIWISSSLSTNQRPTGSMAETDPKMQQMFRFMDSESLIPFSLSSHLLSSSFAPGQHLDAPLAFS